MFLIAFLSTLCILAVIGTAIAVYINKDTFFKTKLF